MSFPKYVCSLHLACFFLNSLLVFLLANPSVFFPRLEPSLGTEALSLGAAGGLLWQLPQGARFRRGKTRENHLRTEVYSENHLESKWGIL
jgi:hypothetical protein